MSWVPVADGEDVPAGTKVRITYRVDVPSWLEWTPDQIMDMIMTLVGNVWARVKSVGMENNLTVERYEVLTVDPGNIYDIVFYCTSRGAVAWYVAIVILAVCISVPLIYLTAYTKSVEKLVEKVGEKIPTGAITMGAGALLLFGLAALVATVKPRGKE